MLIDFCHHSVKSNIKADKVSFDGYEVTNLISEDPNLKNRGFMSENFIKPPVNITLQFPCNIAIYRIIINPVIGQQVSCDMKLFAASNPIVKSWLYGNKDDNVVNTDGVIFNFIGNVSQVPPSIICFQNQMFRERNIWRKDNMPDRSSFPTNAELKFRKPGALCHASHVTLCVTQTRSGRSVAIKKLEIWGMPSVKVPNELQLVLRQNFCEILYPKQKVLKDGKKNLENTVDAIKSPQEQKQDKFFQEGVEVPEDFVDQITYDIMSVPMLLPSGKCIDQSTLEHYINIEASWGRPPNDPFTGVAFSQGSKAFINTSLKSRIDQFVLKNSQILNVPRTLGKTKSGVLSSEKSRLTASRLLDKEFCDKETSDSNICVDGNSVCESKCTGTIIQYNFEKTSNSLMKPQRRKRKSTLADFESYSSPNVSVGLLTPQRDCLKGNSSQNIELMRTSGFSKANKCTSDRDTQSSLNWIGDCVQHNKYIYHKKLKTVCGPSSIAVETTRSPDQHSLIKQDEKEVHSSGKPAAVNVSRSSWKHCDNLTSSLDTALINTLGNLPSFTRFSSKSVPVLKEGITTTFMCCTCNSDCSLSSKVKYRLPCSHVICRDCVQRQTLKAECGCCLRKFTSAQLNRVFE